MERRGRYVLDREYPWNYPQSRLFSLIFGSSMRTYEGGTSIIGIDQGDKLVSRSPMIDRDRIKVYFAKVDPISQSYNSFPDIYIYSFLSFLYFFSKKEEQSMRCYHTTYTRIHSTYLHLLLVINDLNTRSVPCFANRSVYTIGVSIKRRPNA